MRQHFKISVYDVASRVLPMFDASLAQYAVETYKRQNVDIKTSQHVEELRRGFPGEREKTTKEPEGGFCTLRTKEEGDVGIGMCVWSTGVIMNPFVQKALDGIREFPDASAAILGDAKVAEAKSSKHWAIKRHPKMGTILIDDRFRVQLETRERGDGKKVSSPLRAIMKDVFAIGDTATLESGMLPATAQVANQEAIWLSKRLNRGDITSEKFGYKNLGIMTYLGASKAIFQGGKKDGTSPELKGRTAYLIWRGAYLTMTLSWRSRILVPIYWAIVKLFGRDISRF